MASRSEDSKAENGAASEEGGPNAESGRRRPSADAVERALAEVSLTLERLKQVRNERVEAEARFRAEIKDREERIEAMQARLSELEASSDALAKARADAIELVSQRDEAVERLARLEASQRTNADELERARTELAETRMSLEQQAGATERAAEALAQMQSERDDARRRAEELAEGLGAAERDLDLRRQTISECETKLEETDRLRAQIAEMAETLESARKDAEEWEQLARAMEARTVAAEESVSRASTEADENTRVLESTIERQRAELDHLTRETAELREVGAAATARSEELAERLGQAEASGGDPAAMDDERRELAAALEGERAQVRELSEKLDMAADRIVDLQQVLAAHEAHRGSAADDADALASLNEQLAALRERLQEVERERDALRDMAEESGAAVSTGRDESNLALRRRRLRRARKLLREHAAKADQVEGVLAQRMAQCEEVLSRRRELVQARDVIERAHKRVISSKSRSGAAATVFFGLGTMAVLAALSWAVVTRTFPARYAASAVLAAEFTGTGATPETLASWQEFHEKLLLDPQLMSSASERLAQRGFVTLSQPAALKMTLERDMTWTVPEPGKIAFELRGLGRESTARALESYLTSLVAQSSALRQRRSESSTTVIAEPVRAGVEPIEDPRLAYAGIGLAGGVIVCLLLWLGIWRRMVKTKAAFENSTAVEHLLEDARWVDPIQKIIESPGDGSGSKAA